MILNFYKKQTKVLSLAAVANKFDATNDRRKNDFGINKFV